jgi:hypothetical protein
VLTRGGRAVALLFVFWLCGLILAGLGVIPAGIVPLSSTIGAASPTPLRAQPTLQQPNRSDLLPALPLGASASQRAAAALARSRGQLSAGQARRLASGGVSGRSSGGARRHVAAKGHGHGTTTGSGTASATHQPPGQVKTSSSGKAGSAPGHVKPTTTPSTTAPGKSGTAPGHTGSSPGKTGTSSGTTGTTPGQTATTPGQSGSAPGQTLPHGNGRGSHL